MRSTAPTMRPAEAMTSGAHPKRGGRRASARTTRQAQIQAADGRSPDLQELVLDRYRLLSPLGAGAFATVWLAIDERLAREVAVKVIPHGRVMKARFEREAWAAARLSHPGIVTLYEAAADRDAAYLVSELVRGSTLERALDEGWLSDRAILTIGASLCDALGYAHATGIIHRDVKPSNVLIPDEPPAASPRAKLTDFGVAYAIGGNSLTATGDVVGTAAYMAPEQAAGREARPAADLYALALVLYEALTGINPIAAAMRGQRGMRLGVYLPPLRRQRRDLPRELGLGIDLALRPRAVERGTVDELRAALEASASAVSDETGIVGDPWWPPIWRKRRRETTSPPPDASGAMPEGRGATTWQSPDQRRPAGERRTDLRSRSPRGGRAAFSTPIETGAKMAEGPDRGSAAAAQAAASPPRTPLPAPVRAGGAAAGAVVTGWLAAHVLASAPLAPAATALAAAAMMLVLPRVGFVVAATAVAVLAVAQGHAGDALVIVAGAAVAMIAAPGGKPPWTLAVGAPLLGVVGLAGAWPALAARAATARGRAALAFTGCIWLALAGTLTGAPLYVEVPPGGLAYGLSSASLHEASHHALGGLIGSGALAPAPVWALAAAILPLLVSRRSLMRDLAAVVAWAGLLVVLTELAISVQQVGAAAAALHSVLVGALAAAAVAIAPSALAAWRTMHGGYTEARVP